MPRADLLGFLEGPYSGDKGKKDAKIGSASERRNNLASERSHIKHTEQYQVLQGMDSSRKETKRWSDCIDW